MSLAAYISSLVLAEETFGQCSVAGCGKKRKSKGFFQAHYWRWRTHGDPLITLTKGGTPGHINTSAVIKAEDFPRLRALLAKECMTFSEIGRRFGVTGERIRQLANREGCQEGRNRIKVCTLRTTKQRIQDEFERIHAPLIAECAKHGLSVEPVRAFKAINAFRCSPQTVRINGKLCAVQTGSIHYGYHYFRMTSRKVDFAVVCFPNGWLVLPQCRLNPGHETMFALNPRYPQMGNKTASHNWPDYWEAWHLLGQKGA